MIQEQVGEWTSTVITVETETIHDFIFLSFQQNHIVVKQ